MLTAHPKLMMSLSSRSFFFIFSVVLVLLSTTTSTAIADDDGVYMLKLLNALTPTPTGWSHDTNLCTWKGVGCDQSGRVDSIYLFSSSLTGTIPSNLNSLSHLTYLYLQNNFLTGPFPSLANLTELKTAYLGSNNFTSVPHGCFQGLTSLKTLSLSKNINLQPWTFPTDLTQFPSLDTLELEATNLIGSLPAGTFDLFPSLRRACLSYNNITGALPLSLGRSSIRYLWLYNTGLTGTLEVISSMKFLCQAWLQNNHFTGPIPDLSNCTYLLDLRLHNNNLTGMFPPSLMGLPVLKNVSLANNRLQGPIPVFGESVKVDLGGNSFCRPDVGPCDPRVTTLLQIAAAFGYPFTLADSWSGNDPCKYLRFIVCAPNGKIIAVNLEKQNLNGTISPAFANLTSLVNLTLSGNNLIGSIPESLTTLSQLELLDVSNNNLSGQVPKFPPKVKLITKGNAFLLQPSPQGTSSGRASKWNRRFPILIGASAAGFATMIFSILIICYLKKGTSFPQKMIFWKRRNFIDHYVETFMQSYGSLVPKRYSYSEIKRITNSFQNKLGQGGYGVVYKAKLPDGHLVAVKVIIESKGSGEEFINEVASISRTSHVNIVSLLGFCYDMNKRALIYEFMPNGSLDNFISRRGSPNAISHLNWSMLYNIAIGIAKGLEYLHRGCNTRILHLDIKPQNILLDEDFCPKISDFGLAKICKKKESVVSILGTRGTPGYIAPEIYSRAFGGVSHKSDVYSYGMLILEIVGARKSSNNGGSNTSEMYFPDWIYKDLEQGNISTDVLAITEEDNDMARKMILVSLWCIQTHPTDRPSMSKVVEMLEGPLQSVPYPPKPVLRSPERTPLQISNLSSDNMQETNSITMDGSI